MPTQAKRLVFFGWLAALAACQPPQPAADAPSPASTKPAQQANAAEPPPDFLAASNARYQLPGQEAFTLQDGRWQGEPFVAGGASAPSAGLLADFYLRGDLNGDGNDEAVVLLYTSSGGSGTFDFLAVIGRDSNGQAQSQAFAALGDRVTIRDAEIQDGILVVDVVQGGPDDAACCPGQKVRRRFVLQDQDLVEQESEDQGRQSIADLANIEWRLVSFGRDEALPDDINITLMFTGDRISGSSGCNRYMGSVTESLPAGTMSISGPLGSTRMACPPPASDFEIPYLTSLAAITQYSFLGGRLALNWRLENEMGTLIYSARDKQGPDDSE
jgi:heat shock protein HslJ